VNDPEIEGEQKREIHDRYSVNIVNEDDGSDVEIGANRGTTISEIIAEMYTDFRLERKPGDRLHCRNRDGVDVFQFSALTIDEYLERGQCPELKWAFAAETGGA
jgi:hypothetical protein